MQNHGKMNGSFGWITSLHFTSLILSSGNGTGPYSSNTSDHCNESMVLILHEIVLMVSSSSIIV